MPSPQIIPSVKRWAQSKSAATTWRARKILTTEEGTQEITGYGATKQEALKNFYERLETVLTNTPEETSLVSELFAEFLQHKRSVKGVKDKTIHGDKRTYLTHIAAEFGKRDIADITLADVQRLQHHIVSQKKYRTAELVTILLKSFLAFARKRYRDAGILDPDDIDKIRRPQGARRKVNTLWSPEQVKAFLRVGKARYEASAKATTYPLFYTALAAGLRRGELLGLPRSALGCKDGQYYLDITEQLVEYDNKFHPETPKTLAGVRRVPIPAALAETLKRHMARMDEIAEGQGRAASRLMFPSTSGTPLTTRTLYRSLEQIAKGAEVPPCTLHELRKCYTSYLTRELIKQGTYSPKLVARLLGHSSPEVSLSVYTLVNEQDYGSSFFDPFGE